MKIATFTSAIISIVLCLSVTNSFAQSNRVTGTVTDASTGDTLPGVNIRVKGTSSGTSTASDGTYSVQVESLQDTLIFSYVGFQQKVVPINGRSTINLAMETQTLQADEMIVVGYGEQKKGNVTGSISSVSSEELEKVHNGATVSTTLAGKMAGLSFKQSEGRPGASASIQVRNMGSPLYVIDGIVKDEGQFNNLSSNDIKNISVLKGAQAAIYGSRAANGVVVVTTKRGDLDTPTEVGIDSYVGWQNLTAYPNNVLTSGYEWNKYAAEAQLNQFGSTSITPEEIQKWKEGTEYGYRSFDWPDFIFQKNAPQVSLNAHASGGSEKTNYYFSVTRLDQNSVFKQYNFDRTNLQTNIDTRIGDNLKVGTDINARIEDRNRPGVPGYDDYFEPLFASMRNRPTEHPYANGNPNYLNDIGHNQDNAGLWTYDRTGHWQTTWRVIQINLHGDYELPIDGLSVSGKYGYYYANQYQTNHEFTYDAFTYNPTNDTYTRTGGSNNPFQERTQELITEHQANGQLEYQRSFGRHNIHATALTEWYDRRDQRNYEHNVPEVNELDIIRFNSIVSYDDSDYNEARISYAGRFTYNYAQTYYFEFAAREDASWKFPPNHRYGFFPSVSAGWRITNEPFYSKLGGVPDVLTDLKFRVSYGKLGDDNIPIGNYAYYPGYNYAVAKYIFDGETVNTSNSRGEPITNITWFTANDFDVGADYELWNGKVSGSLDYFYRKRTGLLGNRYNVLIPSELGYALPQQNQNSDAQFGGEFSINYNDNAGDFTYSVGGNVSYSRSKFLHSKDPRFGNSWDRYRFSGEERYNDIFWGYQVVGQFQSQEQINNYDVNVDGQGNTTLLPGDFIYKDVNNDGVINGYDERPIGYGVNQPDLYGGLQITLGWKGIDFSSNFSFGSMYSYNRYWEARWPFQNDGNLLTDYLDRWHRTDPRDPNSQWISGKYPPLRFNDPGHSNYNKNSDFWLVNINYLRLRTLEVGYTFPQRLSEKVSLTKARIYVNTYNLFSFDNAPSFLDPEIEAENGLQYPQAKYVNIGVNLTF